MAKPLLFSLMLALLPAFAATAPNTLRFVVYHPHFPPYIYSDGANNPIIGIIPELLAPFFLAEGIKVEYLYDNRAGAEQRLYKGEVDAMMLSPDWAMQPEKLLFSIGIMPYHDYLFARTAEEVVQSIGQLQDKTICTRQYYVYPTLQPLFAKGTLLRLDSSSQEAQLRMVLNKRCDLVYMNDLIVHWLAEQKFAAVQMYPAAIAVAQSELNIALNPRWQPLLPRLNAFLLQQQQNGEVQRVTRRYVKR